MVPFGDQQPFLLQLGKFCRHGGAFHAEKIRQLLTVKGNVKGEGGLPDGLGRQVGQQFFPGGSLADMGDFAKFNEVYAKYFVSKPARSCVAVKTLPTNVLCEVELIASVGLIR